MGKDILSCTSHMVNERTNCIIDEHISFMGFICSVLLESGYCQRVPYQTAGSHRKLYMLIGDNHMHFKYFSPVFFSNFLKKDLFFYLKVIFMRERERVSVCAQLVVYFQVVCNVQACPRKKPGTKSFSVCQV